ncbi:MAG: 4Fe-4S dicluster domain-containing protein [Bacteroidales bacterium]|nr:4Fe-4S dicluster domain-containing protein [Bacteroidales bacterium]
MKYPKLRELREAVVSLFTPAYTSSFPAREHIPEEKFRGKPVVNEDGCVGCMSCANVCPPIAITVSDDAQSGIRTIIRDYGRCIFCGQCEAFCITGEGVKLSNMIYDMAVFDRDKTVETQTRELLICSHCGGVITTKEHVEYLFGKLGTKGYSSTLALHVVNQAFIKDPATAEVEIQDELKRKDMFNIMCPDCQRSIQVKMLQ